MTTLASTLAAISAGAVFMGANTYIGNAPNFMVYAIARERGVKMPSFFGYMLWSGAVLIPTFLIAGVAVLRRLRRCFGNTTQLLKPQWPPPRWNCEERTCRVPTMVERGKPRPDLLRLTACGAGAALLAPAADAFDRSARSGRQARAF